MQTFPKPLTPGEERACLERLQEGDREARDILIERNLRLVAHVVKKYQGTEYETEDLLSVGTIGLIKAVNTFRPDRGSRLATYAAKCIENEILMLFRAGKKYNREVSLFEPIGVDKDGESVSLVDVIELETRETLEDLILEQDKKALYEAYACCLKPQEQTVVKLRYGLFGTKPRTQREIAKQLGISRSYVSRIEKRALKKLAEQLKTG
ncbi:RNA polymerase sporulation sigma factor SigK [Clostridium sp. OF09-36]|uniref:RNA polymerase sporulation sigma factor SigK n=1 Tax=Clostridium sp. OF09-36 TaxID=2292310 RepID=UPI000E4C71FD|nr:RNA polymerase sporulation sigma factor SigK [Clostridium sp. OF09-36]RHV89859.1 RNA polymerase sporulation sigma factor SigK [Clostridium sp. OF09-36]